MKVQESTAKISSEVKLTDLFSPENLYDFDSSSDGEETQSEPVATSQPKLTPDDGDGEDDVIEELTKVGTILFLGLKFFLYNH